MKKTPAGGLVGRVSGDALKTRPIHFGLERLKSLLWESTFTISDPPKSQRLLSEI
jgi:hypothetical protein